MALQEYAGVESFQRRFRSIQAPDANGFRRGDTAQVAALAVEPAADGVRAFESLLDSSLKTEQLPQPLTRQLLRIRRTGSPTLHRAVARSQRARQLVLRQAGCCQQSIESLAGRHFKES